MGKPIFRDEAMENISANQFQDYIKTSHASLFLITAACILGLAALCLWGFFGEIPVSISRPAVCRGGELVCYMEVTDGDAICSDSRVVYNSEKYAITDVGEIPLSREEIRGELGNDGIFTRLDVPEWGTELRSDAPDSMEENTICQVQVLVDSKTPVQWLFQ